MKILPLLCLAAGVAQAADVQYIFTDFTTAPQGVRKVFITPLGPYGTNGNNIMVVDRRTFTNDASGSLIVSNVIVGYNYRVEFSGAYTVTVFTNAFPGSASGLINAKNYLAPPLVVAGATVAYSQTQADARFYPLASNPSNYATLTDLPNTNSLVRTNDSRALNLADLTAVGNFSGVGNFQHGTFGIASNSTVVLSNGDVILRDSKQLRWLNTDGTASGAAIWEDQAHPYELHIDGRQSVFIGPSDGSQTGFHIQLGPASGAGGGAYTYLPRESTVSIGTPTSRSQYLFFNSAWWNGSATRFNGVSLYASTDTAGNAILECSDLGTADGVGVSTSIAFRAKGNIMMSPSGSGIVFPTGVKQNAAATSSFFTLIDTNTVAFDAATYCNGEITLGGNRTLSITGAGLGQRGMLKINQDGTGSRTLAVGANTATPGSVGLTLTTGANSTDIYDWAYDGTLYHFSLYAADSLAPFDADAQTFITAAGLTNLVHKKAVNRLVLNAKAHLWWTPSDVIYPFVGGTSNSHAINLKDPTHYNITFTATGVTHDTDGITGNGSSGYGDTGFNPTAASSPHYNLDSASLFVYVGTASPINDGRFLAVASGAGNNRAGLLRTATVNLAAEGLNAGNIGDVAVNMAGDFRGATLATRTSSSSETIYTRVGAQTASVSSAAIANGNFYVDARSFGGVDKFSDANLRGAAIGGAISASIATNMLADWVTFETDLGRNVP